LSWWTAALNPYGYAESERATLRTLPKPKRKVVPTTVHMITVTACATDVSERRPWSLTAAGCDSL